MKVQPASLDSAMAALLAMPQETSRRKPKAHELLPGSNYRRDEWKENPAVLTAAKDRVMQLSADICNIPDFCSRSANWKVSHQVSLKRTKVQRFCRLQGGTMSELLPTRLSHLDSSSQLLWVHQVHQSFPTVNHTGLFDTEKCLLKRKVLHLKLYNLLPLG